MTKRIGDFFLIGKLARKFDSNAQRYGLSYAMKKALTTCGSKIFCKLPNGEKNILENNAVIIATMHPVMPVIATLPPRRDIFLIVSSELMTIGPWTKQYFIPVYVKKHYPRADKQWVVKLVSALQLTPSLSDEEAHEKNKESIRLAAEILDNGGIVIIVPEGVHGTNGTWFSGIGHLINNCTNPKNIYYMKSLVKPKPHISFLSSLLLFPDFFYRSFKVFFSQSHQLTVLQQADAKKLTKELEEEYKSWTKQL